MIEAKLYKKLPKKGYYTTLGSESQSLTLEFDSERRCFRLFQASDHIGSTNFEHKFEAEFAKVLNRTHYIEKVTPIKPFHNYLLIDAITLKKLIDEGKIIAPKLPVAEFRQLVREEENEQELLKIMGLSRTDVDRRVWFAEDNRLKTCIDDSRNIYIHAALTAGEQRIQSLKAFKKFVNNEAFIRIKDGTVPLPGNPQRRFSTIRRRKKLHGADDATAAISGSKQPLATPDPAQAFAIFPLFLSIVAGGIKVMEDEAREQAHELDELKRELAHSQHLLEELLEQQEYTPEKIAACLESLQKVKLELGKLPKLAARIKAYTSGTTGITGANLMFAGIAAYEIDAIIGTLTQTFGGYGANSGFSSLSLGNYGTDGKQGVLTVGGTGVLIGGELLMMTFVLSKIAGSPAYQEMKRLRQISASADLSDSIKKIIKDIESDRLVFDSLKLLGNMTLLAGQALGLSPIAYVGLGLSIGGIALETIAEITKEKRHDFEIRGSKVEDDISHHYLEKMVGKILEFTLRQDQDEEALMLEAKTAYSEITREQTHSEELLFRLICGNLVMQKILKETYKADTVPAEAGFFDGAMAAQKHYESHSHQSHLLNTIKYLIKGVMVQSVGEEKDPRFSQELDIEDYFEQAIDMGPYAFKLFHYKLIEQLNPQPQDSNWIIQLGAHLSKFKDGDLTAIAQMAKVAELPKKIAACLKDIAEKQLADFTYQELVSNIQIAFIADRLEALPKIIDDIRLLGSEEARAAELQRLFLANKEVKTDFTVSALQNIYEAENPTLSWLSDSLLGTKRGAKSQGKYDPQSQSFIEIIGTVDKPRKYLWGLFTSAHTKNVYAANMERLERLPVEVAEEVLKREKFLTRSLMFEILAKMSSSGISTTQTAHNLTQEMRQAHPHAEPHATGVVHLENHHGARISEV